MNLENNRLNRGFAAILAILILVGIIALVLVGAYLFNTGKFTTQTVMKRDEKSSQMVMEDNATPAPVSSSTDMDVIQKELNDTKVGTPDTDLNSLKEDASSL